MRRRLLIALFAFGTVAGYGSGFASLYRWHHSGYAHGGYGFCHHGPDANAYGAPWAPPPPPPRPAEAPPAPPQQAQQTPATPGPG